MRRFVPFLVAGVALIATACGDAIAPTRSEDSMLRVAAPLSKALDAYVPAFATRELITIPAAGGVVKVGGFTLYFAKNSVCDPLTSGYGPETWDNSCATLNTDYTLTAAFWQENGKTFIEFIDDIRFAPDRWVVISAKVPHTAQQILYFRRDTFGSVTTKDEAAYDSSLRTFYSSHTGELYRRIKHFSGYVITSGRCDPADPSCTEEAVQ